MDFALTPEQHALRTEIVRFARGELNEEVIARDRGQVFRRDLWQQCAAIGLTGLAAPEPFGSGLDAVSTAIALEALGYGCEDGGLTFSICAHLLAGVVPVAAFGSEAQKDRYLPGLCGGSSIAANAATEPEAGSDIFSMRAEAVREGNGFVLSGAKTFCTNAPVADLFIVLAVTDRSKGVNGGITAFLVDRTADGLSVGPKLDKMGLRTSPTSDVALDEVRVGEDAVLGGVGAGGHVFGHAMQWERVCLFAAHVGTTERLLDAAVRYARSRRQFGQAIAKFQAVSHRLADMKIRLEASRLLVYRAAWEIERSRAAALHTSIAKVFASESYVEATAAAIQTLGGYGFMTDAQVERAARDAYGSLLYSGTSDVQRNIIAGWLGL
jgi:alkylation response protein AidB-like acyl-CoA dehydrogenase